VLAEQDEMFMSLAARIDDEHLSPEKVCRPRRIRTFEKPSAQAIFGQPYVSPVPVMRLLTAEQDCASPLLPKRV
jgi:hypothetical protein